MKILFFHRWVGVHGGGTETHLLELAKRFCELGHNITILTREGNRLYDIDKKIRVIRISRNFDESEHSYEDARVYIHTILFMLKSLLKLFLLNFKGEKFDVVSVHFTTEAIIARIFKFFAKTPFIFVLEGYTPYEAIAARYADARISISDFEAKVYEQKHNLKSKVIPVGIDTNRFSVNRDESLRIRSRFVTDKQILVLTVCRLEPRKDIFTLIDAARLVNGENKDIKFIIAGDGILKSTIEKVIKESSLSSFITLAGFVSDEDLPYYYGASDIFILTSKEEWFGIVFLEAMANGLPIIATNVGACPEVVGSSGIFFDRGDYKELANKILELASNAKLRQSLSFKSKSRVHEFDWNKQILLYEEAYKSVLRGQYV